MPEFAYEGTATDPHENIKHLPNQPDIPVPNLRGDERISEFVPSVDETGQSPHHSQERRITDALLSSEVGLEFVMRYVPWKIFNEFNLLTSC